MRFDDVARSLLVGTAGLLMVFALACGGGGPASTATKTAPVSTSPSPTTEPTPTATPVALDPLIHGEIGHLENLGFTVDQVAETSLDGTNQHVAMRVTPPQTETFDPSSWEGVLLFSSPPAELFGGQAVLLYEARGNELVRIFDRLVPYISLEPFTLEQEAGPIDIDADGVAELVVEVTDGGNCWACVWLEIYSVHNGAVRNLLETVDPLPGAPREIQDIDGDGVFELLILDDTFESELYFCHACSPWVWRIYKPMSGAFVEASAEYPAYYNGQISQLTRRITESSGYIPDIPIPGGEEARPDLADSNRARWAIELFLLYDAKGDVKTGWEKYKEIMRVDSFLTEDWKEQLPAINVVMAHAYGFSDFGADKYLRVSDYPPAVQQRIQAVLRQARRPHPSLPYRYEPDFPGGFEIGRSSSGEMSVYYDPRLDYFRAGTPRPEPPFVGTCSDPGTQMIGEILGMDDLGRLLIYNRILNGC